MKKIFRFFSSLQDLLTSPISNWQQVGIIVLIAFSFYSYPGFPVSDWDLNIAGLWENGVNIYKNNPNAVYPPWGLILLFPYYLLAEAGSRIVSALVIGWLCVRRGWSVSTFGAIVFNPYFVYTMTKSNMDILVFIFPILLWAEAEGKKWQGLGQGVALSLLLLKPQASLLLLPYLLWQKRKNWRELILPLSIVVIITVPISFIGQPPLFLQWLENIFNPSVQNQTWWLVNNISLTSEKTLLSAIGLLLAATLLLYALNKSRQIVWEENHTFASLLFISMFLSPYTSNQTFIAGLAFVPSWGLNFVIGAGLSVFYSRGTFLGDTALFAFPIALAALYLYNFRSNRKQNILIV